MIHEKEFYERLADTPELPAGLYQAIDRKIRKRSLYLRPVLALAAALVVAAGTTAAIMTFRPAAEKLSPELSDELQSAHEYLNGGDLEKEQTAYVMDEE